MVFDIYCDESRQDLLASQKSITDTNAYCCIGGLMVPQAEREIIKKQIKALKEKHNVFGEIKWGTVAPSRLPFFSELIDLFFLNDNLQFRTVIIDSKKINNSVYNNDDQELGYYKFYYQLLYHWLSWDNSYCVFTDQKTNKDKRRLQELKRIVNAQFSVSSPINNIQAIDSKESVILQLENVIMGAVGYKYNFRRNGNSTAKEQIVSKVESWLGHEIRPTSSAVQKLNIFEISLREDC